MRDLEIGELSQIVRGIFGLPDDADGKIFERLKHMRKLAFPSASKVGQGHRRTYRVGEVLKVAVAFQLIDGGLSSALAVRLTAAHWPTIAETLVHAIHGGRGRVELTPNAVTHLSGTAVKKWAGGRCSATAALRRQTAVDMSGPPSPGLIPSPALLIDLGVLVRAAKRAFKGLRGVSTDELDAALKAFRPPGG